MASVLEKIDHVMTPHCIYCTFSLEDHLLSITWERKVDQQVQPEILRHSLLTSFLAFLRVQTWEPRQEVTLRKNKIRLDISYCWWSRQVNCRASKWIWGKFCSKFYARCSERWVRKQFEWVGPWKSSFHATFVPILWSNHTGDTLWQ